MTPLRPQPPPQHADSGESIESDEAISPHLAGRSASQDSAQQFPQGPPGVSLRKDQLAKSAPEITDGYSVGVRASPQIDPAETSFGFGDSFNHTTTSLRVSTSPLGAASRGGSLLAARGGGGSHEKDGHDEDRSRRVALQLEETWREVQLLPEFRREEPRRKSPGRGGGIDKDKEKVKEWLDEFDQTITVSPTSPTSERLFRMRLLAFVKAKYKEEEANKRRERKEKHESRGRKESEVVNVSVLVHRPGASLKFEVQTRPGLPVVEICKRLVRLAGLPCRPRLFWWNEDEQGTLRPSSPGSPLRRVDLTRAHQELDPSESLLNQGLGKEATLVALPVTAVVTVSKDRTAKIWSAATGACELTFKGHTAAVNHACFSPSCRYLATASDDKTAKLWPCDEATCVRSFEGHNSPVLCTAFAPDNAKLATADKEGTIYVWQIQHTVVMRTLKHHGPVRELSISRDMKYIHSVGLDATMKVWDARTSSLLQTRICDTHYDRNAPVYSDKADLSLEGLGRKEAHPTLNLPSGKRGELKGHKDIVLFAAFSPSSSGEYSNGGSTSRVLSPSQEFSSPHADKDADAMLDASLGSFKTPPKRSRRRPRQAWDERAPSPSAERSS